MAKNWNVKEAIEVMQGDNHEDIIDVTRRFSKFSILLKGALSGNTKDIVELLQGIPDHISVRQINSRIWEDQEVKKGLKEEEEEKPKKQTKSKAKSKPKAKPKKEKEEESFDDDEGFEVDIDFSKMTTAQLKAECKSRELSIKKGMKKSDVINMLEKYESENNDENDDDDDDEWDL